MELIKEIEGTEGRYYITSQGRVMSLYDNRGVRRKERKLLKPVVIGHKPDNLYYAVNLYKDKKMKQYSIHRLVAKAFLINPNNLPVVNHIDENTFNNKAENLEWCTPQHNQEWSLSKREYKFFNPTGEIVVVKNIRKFARDNGLNHGHLYQVQKGTLSSHKKWTLCREEDKSEIDVHSHN